MYIFSYFIWASEVSTMSEQQRRGVKERLGHRGGPGQETMYLSIQVSGGASSSYGGWGVGVMETTGLNRGMGHCGKST